MSTSEQAINEGIDGPDTERASDGYPTAIGLQSSEEEAAARVRRAIGIFDEMRRMLQALAPSEIEAAVTRVFLGNVGEDRLALYWKLYATRHRMLDDLFTLQRSAFGGAVAGWLAPQTEGSECAAR